MFRRYLRLLGVQLKASGLLTLQYRTDFFTEGLTSLFWSFTALAPLFVVYGERTSIEGWSFGESLLVVGWFMLLQGILEGAINPSLTGVVEHIRKGTLDFVLLKPADAQFLVSTQRFQPWRGFNVFTGLALFIYAFAQLGRGPSPTGLLASVVLLGTGTLLLYSLWILTVSMAFVMVRVDNLTYLFTSIFDFARWPSSVFKGVGRGALTLVFTYVIPLALMTTFPAEAMLGRLPLTSLLGAVAGASLFAWVARRVWLRSIRNYTSASS